MKYFKMIRLGALAVLALALATAGAASAQDPSGDWDIEVNMGGSPMAASLTVTKNDDGTYAGVLNSPMGELSLSKVNYTEGESLSFNETVGEGDTAMEFKFDGTFTNADTFEGVLESAMGPMPVKGTRASSESPMAGVWKVTSESQLGKLEREIVVYKSGKAKYVTDESDFAITELTADGSAVTFDVTLDVQDQALDLSFEGTQDGDKLDGVFNMDGQEAATVTGARQPAPTIASLAGDWGLTADTPLGELVATLSFAETGSKLKTDDGDSEVENLDFDANMVVFDVTVLFEGGEYEVTFEGVNSGTSLDGDFLLDGSPVATVSATRQSE